jgi:hypothetical protein
MHIQTSTIGMNFTHRSSQATKVDVQDQETILRTHLLSAEIGGAYRYPKPDSRLCSRRQFQGNLCVIRLFLLFCLGLVSNARAGQEVIAENSGVFLPLVLRSYKPASDSPFWIDIAALHQIIPHGVDIPLAISEVKWKSYLEKVFPTLVDALVESGAGGTRITIMWSDIEGNEPETGQPPNYSWSWYDARLREIARTGLQIIGTVIKPPAWASVSNCPPLDSDHLDEYARFLTDLVNRYKAPPYHIKLWELDNEPDYTVSNGPVLGYGCWGTHGPQYAAMLAAGYTAIKAADPEAFVLMGGLAYDGYNEFNGPFYRYFPDDVMTSNGSLYFDALNIHYFPDFHADWERWDPNSQDRITGQLPAPTCGDLFDGQGTTYYAGGIDLIAKATHFRNRMSTCFRLNKPLWVTELADHGIEGNTGSLNQQARYVIQGNVRGLAAGVTKIVWYAMTTPNENDSQALLYVDLSPKPAFTAFKTLTSELEGYHYLATVNTTNVEGYVFSSPTQANKTVAWGRGVMSFTPAHQLRVVDRNAEATIIDGNPLDLDRSVNGIIKIQLSSEPVFIQVEY